MTAKQVRNRKKVADAQARSQRLLELWNESERVLNFLRSIQPGTSKPTAEAIRGWQCRLCL